MSHDTDNNAHKPDVDDVTGVETTGHEWDGIKELNKPLPKWWLYVFYVSIIWSIGYWILFPAWPGIGENGYTAGIMGYSQRVTVTNAVEENKAGQAKFRDAIAAQELGEIKSDPELLRFAMAGGRTMFGENCAGCHGRGAQGFEGYPNLNDDDWIWGGSLDDIHQSILYGIRSSHDETRFNEMPAYGRDELLSRAEIDDATRYVMTLSGIGEAGEASERGSLIFAEQCSACHGEQGKGDYELGAPNLTDAIWLYGSTPEAIRTSIYTGRGGMMPAWVDRLDEVTIKSLALHVHSLGGGQ